MTDAALTPLVEKFELNLLQSTDSVILDHVLSRLRKDHAPTRDAECHNAILAALAERRRVTYENTFDLSARNCSDARQDGKSRRVCTGQG